LQNLSLQTELKITSLITIDIMNAFEAFDRVHIAPAPRREDTAVIKKDPKYMIGYHNTEVAPYLLRWYDSSQSINDFSQSSCPINRSSFQRHVKKCQLLEMKENGVPSVDVKPIVEQYVSLLEKNKTSRTHIASEGNRYLTDSEEDWLYEFIRLLSVMGHGIGRTEALGLIDAIVNADRPDILCHATSSHVLDCFLKKHPDLKNVAGASLCPQRACKATVETRDAMFTKLDAFVKNMHAAGYLKWA
jgi:hypothetical protein